MAIIQKQFILFLYSNSNINTENTHTQPVFTSAEYSGLESLSYAN